VKMQILKPGFIIIAPLLILVACNPFAGSEPTEPPVVAESTVAPTETVPAPTNTPVPATNTPVPATETPVPAPTATPAPTEPSTPAPQPTSPPATNTPIPSPTATPAPQLDVVEVEVIYHDTRFDAEDGIYDPGVTPWMDLLVRSDDSWYGPERAPDDGLEALPLPAGYRWEVTGGFSSLPNGEAWWVGPATDGTARLIDSTGEAVIEVQLQVQF
jgi:hypothetical protein